MKRLTPDTEDSRFVRRIVLTLLIAGIAVSLYRALDLLILAFGAMLGAITIHALADLYCEKLHFPRKACVPAGIATVLAVIAFLIWLFTWQFGAQINHLVTALPGLIGDLKQYLSRSPVGAKIVDAVQAAFAGSRVARDIGGLVTGSGEMVLNCILLLVGAIFFAADPATYKRGFLLLIPKDKRSAYRDALEDTSETLRLWLRAQLICMTSMGLLVAFGLWISGVPSWAALGLLAGLSEFIPYVGPTAAMLPALGLAATNSTGSLIGALATYAVVRLIQTNFITPFVQARVIDIPPAVTVFAIVGIGMVFGVYALFFSAALLVVIFSLIRTLYLRETLGEDV